RFRPDPSSSRRDNATPTRSVPVTPTSIQGDVRPTAALAPALSAHLLGVNCTGPRHWPRPSPDIHDPVRSRRIPQHTTSRAVTGGPPQGPPVTYVGGSRRSRRPWARWTCTS